MPVEGLAGLGLTLLPFASKIGLWDKVVAHHFHGGSQRADLNALVHTSKVLLLQPDAALPVTMDSGVVQSGPVKVHTHFTFHEYTMDRTRKRLRSLISLLTQRP